MYIPIPSGLTLPEDSDTQPFDLSGKFIVANGKLVPLMIGGQKIEMGGEEEESEDEGYESEEGGEESEGGESEDGMGEMEHGGGCGCSDCEGKKKGNGFMVAIETAMRPKK